MNADIYKTRLYRPHKDYILMIRGLIIPRAFRLAKKLTIWTTMSLQILGDLFIPVICGLTIPHKFYLAKELTVLLTMSLQVLKELFIIYTALMKIFFGLILKVHALFSILQCLGMVGKGLQSLA